MNRPVLASAIVAALALCASAASAAPNSKPPATTPPACDATGPVLFGLDVEPAPNLPTRQFRDKAFRLHDNGAWTYVETRDGKRLHDLAGCLTAQTTAAVRKRLALAGWKVTQAPIVCTIAPGWITRYSASGKVVFTEAMCSGSTLDTRSRQILDQTIAEVTKLTAMDLTPRSP